MIDLDGIAIREEPFDASWAEGQTLIAEHVEEVGPREGVTLDVNVALLGRLAEMGCLQVMIARCNGRMVGYLGTVISPSLEDAGMLVGTQLSMFVSKAFRGTGPRLQRASLDALRARGVGEVILRAGVRGAGPKAGALYRRLGARPHGELYSLILEAA